ncbi:hypothetical protein Tco_0754931 [Tanacetum coccineum]
MNDKSHTLNLENFRDMLQIFPRLPGQKFEDPLLEEEIRSFIRDLGHTTEIKVLTELNVNHVHQPWRSFAVIINRCLSGKTTGLDSLPLSRAQIIWGMYHKKNVDYVYLLWEDMVALSEAEQMKLATKRSKKDFHISHASGSGAGVRPEVLDVPKYTSESKEESWTFSQGEDDDDDEEETDMNDENKETKSDNDGDNLTHPNLSTFKVDDQEEEEENADDEEVSSDQRVSTPPDYELIEEEENQEGDDNVMEGEQEEEEEEELYGDLNLNLERRDAEMTEAQTNQDAEDVHVTLTAEPLVVQQQSPSVSSNLVSKYINPSPDTVSVATVTPSSTTKITQPPIPIIQTLQQTPDSTTTTPNPTTTLPEIPNFASLFGFEQRVSALETKMSEFQDEAQAENEEFLSQVDSNIKAIISDQVKAQTSYAVAASLSEFELKKILIDKIKDNKSMKRLDVQKNLYNALIKTYNPDKDIFTLYGDVVTLKRGRDDQDKDEDPFAGLN